MHDGESKQLVSSQFAQSRSEGIMASVEEEESEEIRLAKMFRRNTKRLRRILLDRFLMAMKEDLAEWVSGLMQVELNAINFLYKLENGVLLCQLANLVQKYAEEYAKNNRYESKLKIPTKDANFTQRGAHKGSFIARDNVANFISWCRDLGIPDVVLFETEDLVLHKNEKTVILTLLDVARKAAKFGVDPPQIVAFETEIDREAEADKGLMEENLELERENDLDQLVQEVVSSCSCSLMFSVKKIGDGKYRFGNCRQLIYVRVMRNHVMVRVGGGWDTLEHYVERHDPCRLHYGGGKGRVRNNQKLTTIMDFNSDAGSVCSSESFSSTDGGVLSSISPEPDDDQHQIKASKSESTYFLRRSSEDSDSSTLRPSKSDSFNLVTSRKYSLLSDDLRAMDVFMTMSPGDGWLRKHLNDKKQAAENKEKANENVDGKANGRAENSREESGNAKMTVESIKKKYGRPVKTQKTAEKNNSAPKSHRGAVANSESRKKNQVNKENVPKMESKSCHQYRSWDQSMSAPKRRKAKVQSSQGSRRNLEGEKSSSSIPKPFIVPLRRPSFSKAHTLEVSMPASFKSVRRRGEDTPLHSQSMTREKSEGYIPWDGRSRLPLPTFGKGRKASSTQPPSCKSWASKSPTPSRNPVTRSTAKTECATSTKNRPH